MDKNAALQPVKVGRLLLSGIGSFKVAVPVGQIDAQAYGALVVVPVRADLAICGVIADIAFESDPLTKVMAGAIEIPQSIFRSLRDQGASIEVSVFTVRHQLNLPASSPGSSGPIQHRRSPT